MKTIFIFLSLCVFFHLEGADIPPRPQTAMNDYTGKVGAQYIKTINEVCGIIHKQSGVAVVAVIINDLDEESIENFSVRLYEKWGIGDKNKNEGILIIAALRQRTWRIETGYGAEGMLPDALARRLGEEYLVPHFRAENYGEGILRLVLAAGKLIEKEKNITFNFSVKTQNSDTREIHPLFLLFLFLLFLLMIFTRTGRQILFFILLSGMMGGGRSGSGGGFGGGLGGSGGVGGSFRRRWSKRQMVIIKETS